MHVNVGLLKQLISNVMNLNECQLLVDVRVALIYIICPAYLYYQGCVVIVIVSDQVKITLSLRNTIKVCFYSVN